jgi:hypothetical protein
LFLDEPRNIDIVGGLISDGLLANRRFLIWRGRIFHPDPEMFTGFLALPPDSLIQRMLHCYGARVRAMSHATAAKPAFIRVQHYGRLAVFRVGDKDIRSTDFDTLQAPAAQIGVKNYCFERRSRVRHPIRFFSHFKSPKACQDSGLLCL